MKKLIGQLSIFTFVGGLSTLPHYAVLITLVQLVKIDPVAASMVGYATGAVVNYYLNYSLTFASKRNHREAFWRFAAVAASGFALNGLIMSFGIHFFQLPYLVPQIAATITVLFWNFTAHRFWTFSE